MALRHPTQNCCDNFYFTIKSNLLQNRFGTDLGLLEGYRVTTERNDSKSGREANQLEKAYSLYNLTLHLNYLQWILVKAHKRAKRHVYPIIKPC